jgi:hypothetical protein
MQDFIAIKKGGNRKGEAEAASPKSGVYENTCI